MVVFDADRPLRVVVFFSGSASGFRYLAEYDRNYGDSYDIVGGFTDDPDSDGIDQLEAAGVPLVANDIQSFYDERGATQSDLDVRSAFDEETRDLISEFDADLVLLSGYMWILTAPIVDAYPIVNVHPADLTITDDGDRVYVGADPVRDAIEAGEPETRSTVHFVTPGVDQGPILVRSEAFPVHEELVGALQQYDSALDSYVDAHQEWMKWDGDGPSLAAALELIAAGRVELAESGVRIDGDPGYYQLGAGIQTE